MSLIDRYVNDLFNYAAYTSEEEIIDKPRLLEYYNYATTIMRGEEVENLPKDFRSFLDMLSPQDAEAILIKFLDRARDELNLLDVRIFSAVQLNSAQRTKIEEKLEDIFGKEVSTIFRVDPSLIGGLRVIAGNAVLDNTIKTRLADMKKNIYKEVYLKQ